MRINLKPSSFRRVFTKMRRNERRMEFFEKNNQGMWEVGRKKIWEFVVLVLID